jgi:FtsH-binding integral membrane protein
MPRHRGQCPGQVALLPFDAATIDAGLRAYMLRVYNCMAGGLALTGIVAYAAASFGFYQSIAGTLLIWIVMLAPLGFVIVLSFGIQRITARTAAVPFWSYAAVMGCRWGAS